MRHEKSSSRDLPVEKSERPRVVTLGDLVAAAFDRTEVVTTDPDLAASLAARTVGRWLGRTGRPDIARDLQSRSVSKPAARRARVPYSRAA